MQYLVEFILTCNNPQFPEGSDSEGLAQTKISVSGFLLLRWENSAPLKLSDPGRHINSFIDVMSTNLITLMVYVK
jgi:hypothetical protein